MARVVSCHFHHSGLGLVHVDSCGGQIGSGMGISSRSSVFSCRYHSSSDLHLYLFHLPLTLHYIMIDSVIK
jgi:hypothetical protein